MTEGSLPFPEINAALNATAAIFLMAGFAFIRHGKRNAHRRCMLTAFSVSVVFLVSYLTYHIQTGARTAFGGEGLWIPVYFGILISHIVLAVAIVPLAVRTLMLALHSEFDRHRRWARFTFPIWLYVSVTGVLVYLFLYQWFPASAG